MQLKVIEKCTSCIPILMVQLLPEFQFWKVSLSTTIQIAM